MTSKPRRYKKMTDITNTNIKAKSGALSTDYKELKTEVMKLQKKGLPFMLTSVVVLLHIIPDAGRCDLLTYHRCKDLL